MKKQTQSGFTLYELLVTLLIIGVVMSLGMANLSDFTRNSRVTGSANDLHAAFMMARSEAARAKTNITICASANSMDAATANCGGTWDQGFIVFIDDNFDLDRSGATETVLRAHPAAATGISLTIANGASYFMFASTGLGRRDLSNSVPVSQVVVCDERGNIETTKDYSAARLFVATPLGRATIVRDLNMVTTALTTMGQTCP